MVVLKVAVLLTAITLISGYTELELEELKTLMVDRGKRSLFDTYCDDKLGCFPLSGGFSKRLINLKPMPRKVVNTQFMLNTRETLVTSQKLVADDITTITSSQFRSSRPTKFIIHGFSSSASVDWYQLITAELLAEGDYNVIHVDWGGWGGSKTLYGQAAANTRIVGAEIAYLLRTIKENIGLDYSMVHLIGHSLGAHICGYAGSAINGLGRITGLDPAGPYFANMHESVRLDPSDAKFVDVIHSDGDPLASALLFDGGLGLMVPSGHADFYPNGGKDQPNCRNSINQNLEGGLSAALMGASCDHGRSIKLFTASINSCTFTAYQCSDADDFKDGKCTTPCVGESCNRMGFHADKPSKPLTKYYLETSGHEDTNFCVKTFDFEVTVGTGSRGIDGAINLKMELSNGQLANSIVESGKEVQEAGSQHTYRLSIPDIDEKDDVYITSLSAKWKPHIPIWKIFSRTCSLFKLCKKEADLSQMKVTSLVNPRTSYFCGGDAVKSGEYVSLDYSSTKC